MNSESSFRTVNVSNSSDSLSCPSCGMGNERSRRFCNGCGEALTFPCPECDSERYADERHCGQCGFGLGSFIQTEQERCRSLFAEAQSQSDVAEAIKAARSVLQDAAPFISELRQKAAALVKQLNLQLESAAAELDSIKGTLRDFVSRRDFSAANKTLASVDVASGDKELVGLVEEIRIGYQRIVDLRGQIQTRINGKDFQGLYYQLIELQDISPNEKGVKGLIDKFGQYELNLGKTLYKKQKYAEASELLQELPAELLGETGRKLVAQAKELSTCQCYLQESPIADVHLLRIGQKLLTASNGSERIEKLVATLRSRLAAAKKETGCELAVWASRGEAEAGGAPKVTVLPCCSTASWSVQMAAAAMEKWRQNFFDWQTAGGAAVQALGLAGVETNLIPAKKKKGLFRRKEVAPTESIGIVFCGRSVHMVRLALGDDGSPVIVDYDVQTFSKNSEPGKTAAIDELFERSDPGDLPIAVTVETKHCIARHSDVPKFDNEKKQIAAIEFEAKHQIPYPLDGLLWDKHVGGGTEEGELSTISVTLVASRKEHVEQTVARFGERSKNVTVVQCDSLALQNWAATAWSGIDSVGKSRAVVSIGERETSIVIVGQEFPVFSSVSWGINDVRMTLEKELDLNTKDVEVVLRAPSQAKRLAPVAEAFEFAYEELLGQLRRSLNGFERSTPKYKQIDEIVLMGEGCTLFGLARYLRLNSPVD